ncbi:MAG TPA: hypothetical protein VJ726_05170 [Candidatus Limnocylindria bacterium]|nr:hypothetical protein [Candidatus Limnocylindria bacterium]
MRTPLHLDSSGLVLGAVVAAAYFLLGAAWPLALGAGLLVFLLKVTLDRPWRAYRRPLPAPEVGSPEAMWLDRAGRALMSIKELRRSARSESIAQRCAAIAVQAEASVATLRRLAYQASVVSGLSRSGARTDRLENTRVELQSRIEGSVLGLEGLVARLAEIVALSEATPDVASVDELAFELDTLRAAMVETEELGRTSVHSLTGSIERGGQ